MEDSVRNTVAIIIENVATPRKIQVWCFFFITERPASAIYRGAISVGMKGYQSMICCQKGRVLHRLALRKMKGERSATVASGTALLRGGVKKSGIKRKEWGNLKAAALDRIGMMGTW